MSNPRFLRGARPTPGHKLLRAVRFRAVAAPLPQFAVVPKKLSVWGNDRYGDCVTAEEAYAVACYSMQCGVPEIFIPEENVIAWARSHGYLNGADLTEVMDDMQRAGLNDGQKTWQDGPYHSVDYSSPDVLKAAIDAGPVKIAIAADALPSAAGDHNGWYTTSNARHRNTDHCVSLSGHGPAGFLFDALGLPLPAGLPASLEMFHLFTWGTIGLVTHPWLMGTCVEAWSRVPTNTGLPSPTPTPVPPPVPPVPPPVPPTPPPPTPPPPVPPPPPQPLTFKIEVPRQDVILSGPLTRSMSGYIPAHTLTGIIEE